MEELIVEKSDSKRIDVYLSEKLDYSRSKIAKLISDETIKVNNKVVKSSYILKDNDVVTIEEIKEEEMDLKPENIPLNIVYEDRDVLVVDKPNGMVVHPAVGNRNGTLVNALLYHSKNLSKVNGEFRPGIVHRIDAYTTGLLMVAKNDKAHEILAHELSNKKTKRKYIALVWGVINEDTATIDAPIGRDLTDRKKYTVTSINSKDAITHFKVLKRYKEATLIELTLETGRTHQIRVHMNYINHPVVNDPVYGKRRLIDDTGQCLHASTLGFNHPKTGEYLEFKSDLPECFTNILKAFENV